MRQMPTKYLTGLIVPILFSLGAAHCAAVPTPAPNPTADTAAVEAEPSPIEATQPHFATVEFWTTDNEPERVQVYEAVATAYTAQNPQVEVRIVPIDEAGVSQRIASAAGANRQPDIVRLGIERVAALTADNLLDQDAATAVINRLGADDFRSGLLPMVTDPSTGQYAAVPFDGWLQAIWYRRDVFAELNLAPPTTWAAISEAACKIPAESDFRYGLTLGTDPAQNYGHQIFEQIAISNNAWPFDEAGNVTMNTPEMVEALAWYTGLQKCAVPGRQFWRGAREAYEYDQAAMLFYSTYIMDDLVVGSDLEKGGTAQLVTPDLAARTGFAPTIQGPRGSATYGQLVTLAIIKGAAPEAQAVVEFFMTAGYPDILALAPFGKVPVLKSAVETWQTSSPYFEKYDPKTLEAVANGYETMQRWLFRPDYNATQRAVIGDIEGRLLIPQVIDNIVHQHSMTPESAAEFLQTQVESLLEQRLAEESR